MDALFDDAERTDPLAEIAEAKRHFSRFEYLVPHPRIAKAERIAQLKREGLTVRNGRNGLTVFRWVR